MESMGWKIVGGADDFEIEAETRKQPKGGYMYFYMAECKRMKGDGTQSGSVKKDVRSKWNSMSDAEKEPYITQSRNDSKEYKERRKAHENKPYWGYKTKAKSVIEVCRSKNWKALASKYGLNHKVTYTEVEEDIKSGSYLGDELKARVLLYLVGIFLCPTGDTSTNKEYMKLICDEGLKGEFNWAEYIHSRLIESIITFKKGSQRYLKGCIAILEVALFDFWSGCEAVPAYERTGVARIRAWGKEEVVRVMVKLKLDRGKKQEMVIGKDVEEAVEAEEKKGGMVVLGDEGEWDDGEAKQSNFDILMSELADIKKIQFEIMQRQSRVEEKLDQVVEKLERHKGVVEGKIDGVVKEVEGVVKEVVDLRSELTGVKGVVDKYSDEGAQLKGGGRRRDGRNEEEGSRCDLYTESVIAAVLDSECPAPQKKKQKVEKADIPTGIDDIEAAICDYLWNSELESGYSVISMGNQFATVYDVATLKPTEWVGGVVIDLLAWTICYDSQKSHRRIGYLPYLLVQQALEGNNKESVEGISTFWGVILDNYVKLTDCEKIMITINYHNSHWYLLVLDMVDHVVTIYDSMFTTEAAKQRVKDAKRLIKILDSYNKKRIWVESCGSLGKYPLKNFKFVEHKKNKQLNGYDCGMYVMMWMESIGSTGATGCWRLGSIASIKRSRVASNQNGSKTSASEARSFSSSSQPSSSQPPPSVTNDSSEEIRSFETLNFRSDMEKQRWQTSFKVRKIRPERVIDLEPRYYPNLVRVFYNNASLQHEPNKTNIIGINTHVMGKDIYISPETNYVNDIKRVRCGQPSVAEDEADDEDDDDDDDDDEAGDEDDDDDDDDDEDDDPNKYIVSATPPSRKLLIFDLNGVLAYIPRLPAGITSTVYLRNYLYFPSISIRVDFNELNTLLVDDSAEKMIYNPKYNYICPHTFDAASHSNDKALEKGGNIREYLENLLKASNVPDFVRNNPFSSD
ncbi:hypothetical protein F3Y22_tig00000002pilonHSYRG00104 [Hibiscus syriacus]|uniref:Ubiquitin-like protease family profile domain-containing protein n=1 Tax=Hibiscus syriacus TaxID=106335 RepID=A0A6A3D8S7_HIBSY|nr:hypothetical protein F3Y22_tig00000002pilonHSYRG00104 [Hibiscus syriacus]